MRQTGLRDNIIVVILRLLAIVPSIIHIIVWIGLSFSLKAVLSSLLMSLLFHKGVLTIRLGLISLLSQLFMDSISLAKLFFHLLSGVEFI